VLFRSSLIERQVLTEDSKSDSVLGNDGSPLLLVLKGLDILNRFGLMCLLFKSIIENYKGIKTGLFKDESLKQ
jgi:hypothetical protein